MPFLSPVSAALPAGCTPTGPTVTCQFTYYADPASPPAPCSSNGGSLVTTAPPTAGTEGGGVCGVYSGPDIQVTSVTMTGYFGFDPIAFDDVTLQLYSGSTQFASYDFGTNSGSVSCPTAGLSGVDKAATLHSSPFDLGTGSTLSLSSADGTAQMCTGSGSATSFTVTGTLLGSIVTTTTTLTQTTTTSTTETLTQTSTQTQTATATVTTGSCDLASGPSYSPAADVQQGAQLAPMPATTTTASTYTETSAVNATTTTTTTFTSTATQTSTVTGTVTETTCTASATGVPQFPIPNQSAVLLVALLLPVIVLMARARRSNGMAVSV